MEKTSTISNPATTRGRIWLGWTGVGVAVGLATVVSVAAIGYAEPLTGGTVPTPSSGSSSFEIRYVACLRQAGTTPDALEHWVDVCQERAIAAERRYLDCLQQVSGSPDAQEHWVDVCNERAPEMRGDTNG